MSLFLQGISNPKNHLTANAVYGRQRTRNFNAGVKSLLGDSYRGERLKRNVAGKNKKNAFGGRAKDMPANSTKYKVDPNPLDLEIHNPNMQPQPHDEAKEVRRYVKRKIALLTEKIANGTQDNEKAALWKREKSAWQSWLTQLQHKEVLPSVRSEFISDFQNWLMGRGREIDHLRTGWYRTPLKEDSVMNYLDAFINERHRFLAALAKLKMRPIRNIDEAYLYYKYIARQNPEEIPIKTFLSDWDKFSVLMDLEWDGEDHPADPDIKVPAAFPGGMSRQSSAAFQQAVNKNTKIGPKATIPILEQKGDKLHLTIPGVTPMSQAKLEEFQRNQAPQVRMIEEDLDKYHLQNSDVSKWGKYSSKGGVGQRVGGPSEAPLIRHDPGGGGPRTTDRDEQDDENPNKDTDQNGTPPDQNQTYGQTNADEQPDEDPDWTGDDLALIDVIKYLSQRDNNNKGKLHQVKKILKNIGDSQLSQAEKVKKIRETYSQIYQDIDKEDVSEGPEENQYIIWDKVIDEISKDFATGTKPKIKPGQEEEARAIIREALQRNVRHKGRTQLTKQVPGIETNKQIIEHLHQSGVFKEFEEELDKHDLETEEGQRARRKLLEELVLDDYDTETRLYNPRFFEGADERFNTALFDSAKALLESNRKTEKQELGVSDEDIINHPTDITEREEAKVKMLHQQYTQAYAHHILHTLSHNDARLYGSASNTLEPETPPTWEEERDKLLGERDAFELLLTEKERELEDVRLTAEEREKKIEELKQLQFDQNKLTARFKRRIEEREAALVESQNRERIARQEFEALKKKYDTTKSENERIKIQKEMSDKALAEEKSRLQELEAQKEFLSNKVGSLSKEQRNLLQQLQNFQGTEEERQKLFNAYLHGEQSKIELQAKVEQLSIQGAEKEKEINAWKESALNAEQLVDRYLKASNAYKDQLIATQVSLHQTEQKYLEQKQAYEAKQREAFEEQKKYAELQQTFETVVASLQSEVKLTKEELENAQQKLFQFSRERKDAEVTIALANAGLEDQNKKLQWWNSQFSKALVTERSRGKKEVEELQAQYNEKEKELRENYEQELAYARGNWEELEEEANQLSRENAEEIIKLHAEKDKLAEKINEVATVADEEYLKRKGEWQAAYNVIVKQISDLMEQNERKQEEARQAEQRWQEAVEQTVRVRKEGQEAVQALVGYYEKAIQDLRASLDSAKLVNNTNKSTASSIEGIKASLKSLQKQPGGTKKLKTLLKEVGFDNKTASYNVKSSIRKARKTGLLHKERDQLLKSATHLQGETQNFKQEVDTLEELLDFVEPVKEEKGKEKEEEKEKEKEQIEVEFRGKRKAPEEAKKVKFKKNPYKGDESEKTYKALYEEKSSKKKRKEGK